MRFRSKTIPIKKEKGITHSVRLLGSGTLAVASKVARISTDWPGARLPRSSGSPTKTNGLSPLKIMSLNSSPVVGLVRRMDAEPVPPCTDRSSVKLGTKLTVNSAPFSDAFCIEKVDDNVTSASDGPRASVAKALRVEDRTIVKALPAGIEPVIVPEVADSDPEEVLKLNGGVRPVTDSWMDPDADPNALIEDLLVFLAATVADSVDDISVTVMVPSAVTVEVLIIVAWASRAAVIQSATVNAAVKPTEVLVRNISPPIYQRFQPRVPPMDDFDESNLESSKNPLFLKANPRPLDNWGSGGSAFCRGGYSGSRKSQEFRNKTSGQKTQDFLGRKSVA